MLSPRPRNVAWLLAGVAAAVFVGGCDDLTLSLADSVARGGAGGGGGGGSFGTAGKSPGSSGGGGSDAGNGGADAEALGGGGATGGAGGAAGSGDGGDSGAGGAGGAGGDGGAGGATECVPTVVEDWSRTLGDASSAWTKTFGDPYVDVNNHRLVVSYDDVVTSKALIEDGRILSHTVTLTGNTAYATYHWVNDADEPLPGLRRNGTGIELGGVSYGTTHVWSTTEPEGFAGVVIPDTTEAVVTLYVKNGYQEYATKVEAGGMTYRSGWRETFNPDLENSRIFFVGENNSEGTGGAGDKIYVGPISGCSNLSDSAVTSAYEE